MESHNPGIWGLFAIRAAWTVTACCFSREPGLLKLSASVQKYLDTEGATFTPLSTIKRAHICTKKHSPKPPPRCGDEE